MTDIVQRREALLLELRQMIAQEAGVPVDRIDPEDAFFRFGIGSAAAVQVMAELSREVRMINSTLGCRRWL